MDQSSDIRIKNEKSLTVRENRVEKTEKSKRKANAPWERSWRDRADVAHNGPFLTHLELILKIVELYN